MNEIYLSIILLFCSLAISEQLTCLTNCSHIHLKHDQSIIPETCIRDSTAEICKGQIIAYYNDNTFPKYLNYTFGLSGNIPEKTNEYYVQSRGLTNFIEYQFTVNAKTHETIIIADIYCAKVDDCALIEIEKLSIKYNNQINPFYQLKSLIYSDLPPEKLLCYDSTSGQNEQCSLSNYPVCISDLHNGKRECSSQTDVHIYYKFSVSSPSTAESDRTLESIVCNKDNCNDEKILINLEKMVKEYTHEMLIMKNTANRPSKDQNVFGLLLMLVFCIFFEI